MTSFNEKFENVLMVIAEKVDKNQYLTSIKSAFTIFMPFVIVGSFATLLNAVIASPKTGLAKWIPALEKTKTEEDTDTINRNKGHVKIMLEKDWFVEALTSEQRAELETISK